MNRRMVWLFSLLAGVPLLAGCLSSTRIEKNENVTIGEYGDLYFIPPPQDPRNVVPRVVSEFESMGYNVKVVDLKKPIEGAQGTGFIISKEGHLLTCAHVLGDEKAATFWIGGVRYEADVVGADKDKDLALLKPRAPIPPVPALSLRNDGKYVIGTDVSTIGYPLGNVLGNNVRFTKGSISSTTGIKDDPKQLQISAQIQPGNSGGPLFDTNGTVLGVVSQTLNPLMTFEQTGGSLPQNVNFAIKSDVVLEFLKTEHRSLHDSLEFNKGYGVEDLQKSVVRLRSGIISEEWEKKPKLVARLDYLSMWDMWYRFRFFIIRVFDFDSQEILFIAGQGRDNPLSNEDKVIKDTFLEVRKALRKN